MREACLAIARGAVCYAVRCFVLVVLWSISVDLLAYTSASSAVRGLLGSVRTSVLSFLGL